jgi:sugar phosphate isomerase/epimerase
MEQDRSPLHRGRFGLSGFWMPGVDFFEAVGLIKKSRLRGFELVPADFQSAVGMPFLNTPGPWIRDIDEALKERMKEALAGLETVTLHAHHRDLNLSAENPGIREESARQYFECARLAVDLGIRTVTFHPGFPSRPMSHAKPVIDHNVAFGRAMAEIAEKHALRCGFENVGTIGSIIGINADQLDEIVTRIGSARFGVLVDIGYTIREGGSGEENLTLTRTQRWFERFEGRIAEVHLHGLTAANGLVHHQPLFLDNVQSFPDLVTVLDACYPEGPIIFEPVARNGATAVAYSEQDLDYLLSLGHR